MSPTRNVRLDQLARGSRAVVQQLVGGRAFTSRLAALGMTKGTRIEVLQNARHGPVLVLVRETRLALGRGEAQKVLVEAPADERPDPS
jgi:Fe2+ transport system protein FeoA